MTDSDRPALAKMLAVLGGLFNEPVDDVKAEGYFIALKDLAWEEVSRAAHASMKLDRFFPRPARLRELIHGNAEDQAESAWNELLREIRRVGYTGTPTLPEATADVVRDMCGDWARACLSIGLAEGPELLGWAKRFRSVYGSAQRVSARLQLPFTSAKALAE